jgi:hypothetical protein
MFLNPCTFSMSLRCLDQVDYGIYQVSVNMFFISYLLTAGHRYLISCSIYLFQFDLWPHCFSPLAFDYPCNLYFSIGDGSSTLSYIFDLVILVSQYYSTIFSYKSFSHFLPVFETL